MQILTRPGNSTLAIFWPPNLKQEIANKALRINLLAIANGCAHEIAKDMFSLRKLLVNVRLQHCQNSLARLRMRQLGALTSDVSAWWFKNLAVRACRRLEVVKGEGRFEPFMSKTNPQRYFEDHNMYVLIEDHNMYVLKHLVQQGHKEHSSSLFGVSTSKITLQFSLTCAYVFHQCLER